MKKIDIIRPFLDNREIEAVTEVIKSGWVAQGPKVREFEEIFASFVGAKYAIACTSCTTALHLALFVNGISKDDEVIIPSLSFIATANSIVHCGGRPVFVDIDPATCNIDPDLIERAITPRTKAIMPVHQMGLSADIDRINSIADKHGLFVVEDAACAIGSDYKGKKIGGHGNIACFSFHPRKIITTGEGGIITLDDEKIAQRLRLLRHQGMSVSDLDRHLSKKMLIETYPEVGYNYRMTDMQAAMGIVQMQKLPEILAKRQEFAGIYNNELSKTEFIRVPDIPEYVTFHNYQSYWIELTPDSPIERNELMEKLLEKGISTRRGIMAIHHEPPYRDYGAILPNTDRITANTLILPLSPTMDVSDAEYVVGGIKEVFCKKS